jgi:hypothetical protein
MAIDIMPTPDPIATPVPAKAQRERIESDAYIAVEELIFFLLLLNEEVVLFLLFEKKRGRIFFV